MVDTRACSKVYNLGSREILDWSEDGLIEEDFDQILNTIMPIPLILIARIWVWVALYAMVPM